MKITDGEVKEKEISSLAGIGELLKVPAKSPVFNFYRYSKGDLEAFGENSGKVKDDTVLNHLINNGFLEEHHRECAITIVELRYAFLNRTGYKINSRVLTDFVGGSIEATAVTDVLDMVTSNIKHWRVRVIQYAYDAPAIDDSALKHIAGITAYRECFDMLYDALKRAWKEIKKKKEEEEKLC